MHNTNVKQQLKNTRKTNVYKYTEGNERMTS